MSQPELPEAWRPFTDKAPALASAGTTADARAINRVDPNGGDSDARRSGAEVPRDAALSRGSKSLVSKLAEVMAAVSRVAKRGHNDFHKYDYATEADIAAAIRSELAERKVMLIPCVLKAQREPVGDKGDVLTTLEMVMQLIDGENGEMISRSWFGWGTDKGDKGGYKAMTGAEKYFLLKTFLIPTGDDPERDTPQQKAKREAQTVRAPEASAFVQKPIPASARATIPDGCALIAEVQAGAFGKARGQVVLIDGSGAEGKYAVFSDELVAVCQQACQDGALVTPEIVQTKTGGKSYLKNVRREESPL